MVANQLQLLLAKKLWPKNFILANPCGRERRRPGQPETRKRRFARFGSWALCCGPPSICHQPSLQPPMAPMQLQAAHACDRMLCHVVSHRVCAKCVETSARKRSSFAYTPNPKFESKRDSKNFPRDVRYSDAWHRTTLNLNCQEMSLESHTIVRHMPNLHLTRKQSTKIKYY